MRVKYQEIDAGLAPYYQCCEEVVRRAGKMCQSIRGCDVDRAISALLLETVAPAALEVALAVQDEIAGRIEEGDALRRSQLERARYEAELARRRYLKVDPDNSLGGRHARSGLERAPPPARHAPATSRAAAQGRSRATQR